MTASITVTITDESTRSALLFALRVEAARASEVLNDGLGDFAQEALSRAPRTEDAKKALAAMEVVRANLAAAHDVLSADYGDTLELPIGVLAEGLDQCRMNVEDEADELLRLSAEERNERIAIYDAAKRLLGEIGEPAGVA
jgi:hypothetical protein